MLAAIADLRRASAPEIFERVGAPAGLVYTTIAKALDRLYTKGLVRRERQGRSFIYQPTVRLEEIDRTKLTEVLTRVFGNGPRPAIATLVDAVEAVDPELLDDLARAVQKRRRARRGT